jgi:hypothetical protein
LHPHLGGLGPTEPDVHPSELAAGARSGSLDDEAMDAATQRVMQRLNPRVTNLKTAVRSFSGGQRQSVATQPEQLVTSTAERPWCISHSSVRLRS